MKYITLLCIALTNYCSLCTDNQPSSENNAAAAPSSKDPIELDAIPFSKREKTTVDINITGTDENYVVISYNNDHATRVHCYPRDKFKALKIVDGEKSLWDSQNENTYCSRITKLTVKDEIILVRLMTHVHGVDSSSQPHNFIKYEGDWKDLSEDAFDYFWLGLLNGNDISSQVRDWFDPNIQIKSIYIKEAEPGVLDVSYIDPNQLFPYRHSVKAYHETFQFFKYVSSDVKRAVDNNDSIYTLQDGESFTAIEVLVHKGEPVLTKLFVTNEAPAKYHLCFSKLDGGEWRTIEDEGYRNKLIELYPNATNNSNEYSEGFDDKGGASNEDDL